MSELKQITKKVISYYAIPEELTEGHWISEYMNGCFVECHLDGEDESDDKLDAWFLANYPELAEEDSFLIEIDY